MAQDKKKKSDTPPPAEEETQAEAKPSVTEKGKELAEDMDKLMDEIDDVLETNAEEFVKNYVQKGGQ
ncbi:MAG: ubiquitin-like protein Pup [Leptospirillia bacterium]